MGGGKVLDMVRTRLPCRIEDLELDGPAGLVAEVVIHDRAVRHIGRMGHFDGEGLIPVAVDACANGLLGLEEIDGRGADGLGVGGDLAQRRDVVENPEAAAVGADHQVVLVVIGVDVEVADGGAGQVLAQRLPVIAIVEADVDGGLGAGEEQARLLGIDAQTVDPASGALVAGQAVDDAGPGLAPSVVRQMSGTSAFSSAGKSLRRARRRCDRRR